MNFASSRAGFEELVVRLNATVDTSRRLPEWPFRHHDGGVVICEFGMVMSAGFTSTIDALTTYYDDREVVFAALSPPWTYHSSGYGFFPGFVASGPSLGSGFAEAIGLWHDDDPTGSLIESSNVVAMAGSSSKWAVTAQRDWEIGLLWTADPAGPWLDSEVPWLGENDDITGIRSPEGWGVPLSQATLDEFRANVVRRGAVDQIQQ